MTFRTRPVTAEFPDYRQVIPSPHNRYAVTCDTQPLIDALQQAVAVGPKHTMCTVSLTCIEQGIRVRLESPGDAHCSVIVPGIGWHPKRYIGVQAPYLLDLLRSAGGHTVILSIADATRPLLVQAEEFTGVVMPVRIDACAADMEDEPATVPVDVAHADDRLYAA
jgi:DNA polymerase III sliding clamp (beta) subunit (PCNA family)